MGFGSRKFAISVLSIIFIIISFFTFRYGTYRIYDELFQLTAIDAQNIATALASNVRLTDADVKQLKKISYKELFHHRANIDLQKKVFSLDLSVPIKYVYLAVALQEDEVRYRIDEKTKEFFTAPIGTKLDILWLLDVPVNGTNPDKSVDAYRYFYKGNLELYNIISQRKSTYSTSLEDGNEWGDSVSGFAPIYTVEGTYVGVLGIDLDEKLFLKHSYKGIFIVWGVLLITNLLIFSVLLFFYIGYLRLIERQKYRDPLTNAYNRRFMDEFLFKKLQLESKNKNYPLMLMMLDIDHFKKINDTYGHLRGDYCLKIIAKTILETLDNPPNILVRYGGEEFLAGITIANEEQAKLLMQKILTQVESLTLFREADKHITISIGAVICSLKNLSAKDIDNYIQKADANLYRAKNEGRNRFCLTNLHNK